VSQAAMAASVLYKQCQTLVRNRTHYDNCNQWLTSVPATSRLDTLVVTTKPSNTVVSIYSNREHISWDNKANFSCWYIEICLPAPL